MFEFTGLIDHITIKTNLAKEKDSKLYNTITFNGHILHFMQHNWQDVSSKHIIDKQFLKQTRYKFNSTKLFTIACPNLDFNSNLRIA